MSVYNTIIIGGGVSGLTAAYKLKKQGERVLVIESGKDIFLRRRNSPYDVANGIGGAGLYSDGKLSFYPSATQLWRLKESELTKAYMEFKSFIGDFGTVIDDFPLGNDTITHQENGTRIKRYESIRLSLEQRLGIIYRMAMAIGNDSLLKETEIRKIRKADSRYEISYTHKGTKGTVITESIIFAGGKHCFQYLKNIMEAFPSFETFSKTEIGIRIECGNDSFDYYNDVQQDVKLISPLRKNREIRTFCCCRDGVVLQNESYGWTSYNGSAGEQSATGQTNIGILVQTVDREATKLRADVKNANHLKGNSISLDEFMRGKQVLLTELVDNDIRDFLKDSFPQMSSAKGIVYYPAVEKMGQYPKLDNELKLRNENIWVCGDATGLFRGLLPAFVSGFFVANCSLRTLRNKEECLLEKIHVKVSSTQSKKVVFAAQSKQSFYCRNAVCEYIFNHDCIPVNPFRIFGYFLDERVDRSLVRNGNNEMIFRCDELWVFGQISDGVLFEIALCRRLGKPVRYFTISAIAKEIKELQPDELAFEPEVHKHQVKKDDLLNLVNMSRGELEKNIQLSLF